MKKGLLSWKPKKVALEKVRVNWTTKNSKREA